MGGPEAGGAEVQGGDPASDTHRGQIPDLNAGGEVPAPQLLAQLPGPLGSLRLVVAQHPPPPLVKDLDVPFARRGAVRQPPQGLGLGAWGREAEKGQTHGETSQPADGARHPAGARSSFPQDRLAAQGCSQRLDFPLGHGDRGMRASRTSATR